jgi:hypothetical protein
MAIMAMARADKEAFLKMAQEWRAMAETAERAASAGLISGSLTKPAPEN